ncbi:class I SAM-dependent methyltransferase [Yoonia sp. 208BN28-4]|uniref:class I SAM-dependent methyltransferase n=1 Tax=Yoonia sp. 208BN28-4 TaxID=3126505 RepID=UPI003097896A
MTALADLIKARIARQGPITLADYMADCLMHPTLGYYATRDPFGADFITAPEISQMFGELLGLAIAQAWLDQGSPDSFTLAELGPGRGTLMADALRATRGVPGFHAAAQVHFVETSPVLRAAQAKAVPDAQWHDSVTTLPDQPLFLIANEFFDALPIRQFTRDGRGWRETTVALVDDTLTLGLTAAAPLGLLSHRLEDTGDGDMVEICPALPAIIGDITTRITAHGGAAFIIDYGDWQSKGDTFQALQANAPVDPLATPGAADLTAHVDFAAIAQAAGQTATPMVPQGVFLERLGITPRAQQLAQTLTGDALDAHVAAHRRLTHPDEMGHLFKVIGIAPTADTPLPGLV